MSIEDDIHAEEIEHQKIEHKIEDILAIQLYHVAARNEDGIILGRSYQTRAAKLNRMPFDKGITKRSERFLEIIEEALTIRGDKPTAEDITNYVSKFEGSQNADPARFQLFPFGLKLKEKMKKNLPEERANELSAELDALLIPLPARKPGFAERVQKHYERKAAAQFEEFNGIT